MEKWPVMVAVALLAAACGSGSKPPAAERGIGVQTADVAADTRLLQEANAAAGEVIRVASDCEALKAALPAAQGRLDAVESDIRTIAARTSLAALRKKVNDAAQLCP